VEPHILSKKKYYIASSSNHPSQLSGSRIIYNRYFILTIELIIEEINTMDNTSTQENNRAYWAKDIAELLEITTSNLRRWSIDLENAGYCFYRDEHNRRAYFEKDIMPLKKLKELLSNNMSKNDAIKAVISMYPQVDNAPR
jgi:hypothetical protein